MIQKLSLNSHCFGVRPWRILKSQSERRGKKMEKLSKKIQISDIYCFGSVS